MICPKCKTDTATDECNGCGIIISKFNRAKNAPPKPAPIKIPPNAQICATCGHMGVPKKIVKGSIIIEFALWLMFLLPGLMYSIWRLSSKFMACPACEAPNMIPINTPKGQKLLAELS